MIPPLLALVAGSVLTFLAFAQYRGAVALSLSFVVGYLFLPANIAYDYAGLPPIDKERAIWLGALVGTLVFHTEAVFKMRWHRADWFLLGAILLSGYSAVHNRHGDWDALSEIAKILLSTALPYLLARIHLCRGSDLVTLVRALFWGAVIYAPLAVWEFRMSPQLHNDVYGYFPHEWLQQVRWGFVRPVLFLGHGLAVGALFGGSFLIGALLLRQRQLRWSLPFPEWVAVGAVGVGVLLSMSFGPWLAVVAGACVYWVARRWRWAPLAAGAPGILWLATVFATGSNWSSMTEPLVAIGATQRAESLQYRLDAMSEYAEVISERPWFGHGGWGAGRTGRATDSPALLYMLTHGCIAAALRYIWLFLIVAAGWRAGMHVSTNAERNIILLLTCLVGLSITTSIFGFGGVFVPVSLVGGAVTGLAAAGVRRRSPVRVTMPTGSSSLTGGPGNVLGSRQGN